MGDPGTAGQSAPVGTRGPVVLRVAFETADALRAEFVRNLAHGAIFVTTEQPFETGQRIQLMLELRFADRTLVVSGHVVSVLPAPMARTGTVPGISIQFLESPSALRERLQEASGLALAADAADPPDRRRRSQRFRARANVEVEALGHRFPAEMLDISYNGMLAMLPGLDLPVGSEARVVLRHPRNDGEIVLACSVVQQARCDNGYVAVGLGFAYDADQIEMVMAFIDELRGYHHAQQLATVSGSLKENTLDVILETFSSLSAEGTLNLSTGEESGRIAFREGQLLYALTGLVSGAKALSRMFMWTDGQFDFHPSVDPLDRDEPSRPLESAILEAAVQRDEVIRLDLSQLGVQATFQVNEERLAQQTEPLDPIAREVVEHAALGFPVGAILDVVTHSDFAVYTAIVDLRKRGILELET